MKPKICMLVLNGVVGDPRVRKEANTLKGMADILVIGISEGQKEIKVTPWPIILVGLPGVLRNMLLFIQKLPKGNFMVKALKALFLNIVIARETIKSKAFIIHANDLNVLPAAVFAHIFGKSKFLIYDSHELWVEQRPDWSKTVKKAMYYIEAVLLRIVNVVITVNESIASELQERYKHIKRIIVLPNYVSSDMVGVSPKKNKRDRLAVLYHGGYLADRGLDVLLKAAERIANEPIDIYLRGFGPIEQDLRRIAKERALTNVHFLEPVPMTKLVSEAVGYDAGILPYQPTCLNNLYSLPNKIFEYMAAGLAVISSDLPEVKKLNEQVNFGILYDPYSPEDLADKLIQISKDRDKLYVLGLNGWTWVKEQGNWEAIDHRIKDLYTDLLGLK